ncbi:MAG: twin-arginine translocase subunit TatB [Betaproteobacteria bacterium HGW-Betaproteobacteria-22]|nr:MAG: twin-arginine translocase subunit TatB [Betaproteobacteria bacterium HGW-Betaproteobacteria-22]
MFDIAFSELLVIVVIALLVIGPEKLPKVARTLGTIVGRMQRYATQIKEEVNRESRFSELQKLQQEIQQASESTQAQLNQGMDSVTEHVTQQLTASQPEDTSNQAINPPIQN